MIKYLGRAMVFGLSVMLIQPAFAAPQDRDQQSEEYRSHDDQKFKSKEERRQYREQRKQDGERRHEREKSYWKAGATLPDQYRYSEYQVDYTQNPKLSPPSRYQQWVKVNNQYMLMNVLTNTIIKVVPE